jgi:Domain of unknown function (DUF4136)
VALDRTDVYLADRSKTPSIPQIQWSRTQKTSLNAIREWITKAADTKAEQRIRGMGRHLGWIYGTHERQEMKTTQRTISITVVLLSLVAGLLAQEVTTDYDRKADFSHYKTFSFEKVEAKDPLWVDRITAAIGGELTAKNMTQVASGGDIAIIAIGMTADRQTLDTFYDTFPGGWGWRWGSGYGDATTTTETYTVGTLVVDLFDRKTKALLWRGSGNNTLSNSSTNNIKNFDKSVKKLFKRFPPQ